MVFEHGEQKPAVLVAECGTPDAWILGPVLRRADSLAYLASSLWHDQEACIATKVMSDISVLITSSSKPLTGPDLQRFLPWTAFPADLHTLTQPPPTS